MARPRVIDPNVVLDAAERIVAERGAGALSIGAVATAAGISKGGVQSAIGTKEGLIAALLARWMEADDRQFASVREKLGHTMNPVRAHISTTRAADESSLARAASLLAALIQPPAHLVEARAWYARRLGDLTASDERARAERLALLATEGAFFLRFLQLHSIDAATWDDIFADIERLASPKE